MGVSLEVWGVIGLSIVLFFLFLFEDHSDGDAVEEGYNLGRKCDVESNEDGFRKEVCPGSPREEN